MAAPILRRDGKKAKILYIEDNPENRMLVRAVLESEGYTVVDAEDGLAGIEAAVREEPALILLDVNLPAIDGYEVVAILKSFPAFANTPVVALTAYAMEGRSAAHAGGRLRGLHPEADRRGRVSPAGRGVSARQARAGRGARAERLPARAQPAPGLPAGQPGRGAEAAQSALRAARHAARRSPPRRAGHHLRGRRRPDARAAAAGAGQGAGHAQPLGRADRPAGEGHGDRRDGRASRAACWPGRPPRRPTTGPRWTGPCR